jgi:transposase
LYGYLNGLRSARKLEKECARNIELNGFYAQSYPTTIVYPTLESRISIGIKKSVQTLCFLKDAELIGCEIIAIDGTKSRAHNSKKANFNQKIDRHLVYIEERTQEYLAELAKMIYRIIALQSLRLQKK